MSKFNPKRLMPTTENLAGFIRKSWDRLQNVPGGKAVFSRLVGLAAPYTGTIGAQVLELKPGFAKVEMRDRRGLRNHLASVHAIALVNLAEVTGNIALIYSMPEDARFIVAAISIDYVKKAHGTITGTATCPVPATNERCEYMVPVELHDAKGELVAKATLKTLIGPRQARS